MIKIRNVFFALFLTLALSTGAAASETRLEVRAPSGALKAGETFEAAVEIAGNPGFRSAQFTLVWDEAELECLSASVGAALEGGFSAVNAHSPEGAIVAAAFTQAHPGDGALAGFSFRAKQDLSAVRFGIAEARLSGENAAPIPCRVSGASPLLSDFSDMSGRPEARAVRVCLRRGLLVGYPDGSFRPDQTVSRGEFAEILWKMAGRPAATASAPFRDLAGQSATRRQAVAWAYAGGYVSGTAPDAFSPDAPLTRQAAMKILFRRNGAAVGPEAMLRPTYDAAFADSDRISAWGKEGMYWGVYHELLRASKSMELEPARAVSRAEVADIVVRYADRFE